MGRVLVIGSSNTDLVCRSPRIPAPGETITGRSFTTFAGGKGANQAVAAARAGADVCFVGACGDDQFGVARLADLKAERIDIGRVRVTPGVSSGVALIVVDDSGENQIVYVPGANATIDVDAAREARTEVTHDVLSLTFETPYKAVEVAVRERRPGTVVVLNAAPYDERLAALLRDLDVLICNEIEASALLGRPVTNEGAIADAAEIVERGVLAVALTLGAHGAVVADASGAWHVAATTVEVVDTTGAGDAFCGAMCAWLADGHSLRDAVQAGVAAGSLAVTKAGAQPSLPKRVEILAALNRASGV
jgi:ribokinase